MGRMDPCMRREHDVKPDAKLPGSQPAGTATTMGRSNCEGGCLWFVQSVSRPFPQQRPSVSSRVPATATSTPTALAGRPGMR